ncbi:MAG: hypothetical protein GY711_10005 [bacterium]|nr:hypothetical protein [bacterium]
MSPLHLVAASREVRAVELLLDAGAELVHTRNSYGQTLLHLGADSGQEPVVQPLLARGAEPEAEGPAASRPLHEAIGFPAIVSVLLAAGARPDVRNKRRVHPLHLAASMRHKDMGDAGVEAHLECARLLWDAGADIEAKDATGETPLFRAVTNERKAPIAALLVERGADTKAKSRKGRSVGAGKPTPCRTRSARRATTERSVSRSCRLSPGCLCSASLRAQPGRRHERLRRRQHLPRQFGKHLPHLRHDVLPVRPLASGLRTRCGVDPLALFELRVVEDPEQGQRIPRAVLHEVPGPEAQADRDSLHQDVPERSQPLHVLEHACA